MRVNKPQVQRDVVGEELREARMELVATYNLTEDLFELHRPSNKGTKLLLKVIKAIIIIITQICFGTNPRAFPR